MKNYLKVIVAGIILLEFVQPSFSQVAAAVPHYYGIEHAIVEYEVSGSEQGKEALYFDQWGMRQAHIRAVDTPKWGFSNTITIHLAEQIMFMDPDKNLGQKKVDEYFKKLLADPNAAVNGLYAIQSLILTGGKKVGDENILNRACDVWEISSLKTKLWLWNGIMLRSEVLNDSGVVKYNAIKVDEATPLDESIFIIPSSIKFLDRDIDQILISMR